MKFADEFRDPAAARALVKSITELECGEVLKGVIKPWDCKVLGTARTPETPIGTCMVSPEGACAAHYNFGRLHRKTAALVGQQRAVAHG
jgi:hydrogenase expression/formation protein HypD